MKEKVPVLMYHSVGIPCRKWKTFFLTIPYPVFNNHLYWLKKRNYTTISLQELYKYMRDGAPLPPKPVLLTFDDGYLDNWTFAYPLLKKYGFRAAIYISPEFIDSRPVMRNNLENVWKGDSLPEQLDQTGFLSWKELEKMEGSGVFDVQSHTMTHTWYHSSDRIIDFRHPGDPYLWMTWNENRQMKPFLQLDNQRLLNYGEPVFAYARAIGNKRFFPDDGLIQHCVKYVEDHGGIGFFEENDWKNRLLHLSKDYLENHQVQHRFESDIEYSQRMEYELKQSKEIIEKKLHKRVHFLCWPGGSVTPNEIQLANSIGYVSSTIGKDIENKKDRLGNQYGEDPSRINRIGTALHYSRNDRPGKITYKNGILLVNALHCFKKTNPTWRFSSLFITMMSGLCKYHIYRGTIGEK